MRRRVWLIGLALLLAVLGGGTHRFNVWVASTELPAVLTDTSVEIRDRHGALLRAFPVEGGWMRLPVRLADVDPAFIDMLVTYEDKRFWSHRGVDPRAMLRAGGQALWHGRVVSGGSTLTMQVARLLENTGTGSWRGKLRQMRVALALEQRLSKDQILELYLLHAPYGGRVEGVRAGTLAWFGKEPHRLTPAEAALMVALPQSPERRRPDRHPEAAFKARAAVLARVGADHVSDPVPKKLVPLPQRAAHVADRMRSDNAALRHDLTLDAQIQAQMEALAVRAVLGQPRRVSAAIVVADHQTGQVLASVGSPVYSAEGGALGFVDMTRALRSPGSTLKPLAYGLAFDRGLVHPETLINDAPIRINHYAPQNFDGQFRGELTIRAALQSSLNIPPVLLTQEIGPARLMAGLRRAGTMPVLPGGKPGLAVVLGGMGLSLTDLVQLYAGIANGGQAQPLVWRLDASPRPSKRIMSAAAAWQLGDILSGIAPPRGSGARAGKIAFKTGTSYGHRDAWAVGFDGRHVIGIWLGRPDGTPVPGAFGGDLAAPLLFESFARLPHTPLPPPPDEVLTVSTAALPLPLQRFKSRTAVFDDTPNRPRVAFPPDGATLQAGDGVVLKFANGVLPVTVLINGAPVITGLRERQAVLEYDALGFSTITVLDATGQGAQVNVRLQ